MIATSLAIRFLLEAAGLAALAYAGSQAVDGPWRWVLAVAAPVAMAVLWGRVAAPRARNALPQAVRQMLGSGILLVAAAALALVGEVVLAALYAAAIVVDTVALRALGATDVLAVAPRAAGAGAVR